jgi:PAS domain S-box-containing protein
MPMVEKGNPGNQHLKPEERIPISQSVVEIPLPVIVYGPERCIRLVNSAFLKLSGFKQTELIGKTPPYPFWKPDKLKYYKGGFFKIDSAKRGWLIQKKGGEEVWTEIINQPIQLEGANAGILSYVQDITEKKKLMETAQKSEEKFLKVFNAIPLPLAITSLPGRKFIEINKAFLKTGGFRREEFIGKAAPEVNWQDTGERDLVDQNIKKKKAVSDFEMRLISKDGKLHTALMSARVVKLKDEEFTISVSTDITKKKAAEKALRESEAFNASLLRDAPNAILVLNLDNSIRFVNPAFSRLTGYSKKELLGIKPPFPWWPSGKNEEYDKENNLSRFQKIDDLERLIHTKNNDQAWINVSIRHVKEDAQIKYHIAIWTDISQRKKAEEALNAELVRRRILIDQSSDGIVVLDQNGAVYEANRRFAEMLGYTHKEIRLLHVWDWGVNGTRKELLEIIRQTDEKGHHFESQHRRKDGTIYDVEVSSNGAQFAGQKLNFCVCRDITARKKAEQALQESEVFNSRILNDAPNPILVTNLDTSFRYANPALEKLTGYSSQDFIGSKAPPPWWPPELIEEYTRDFQKATQDGIAFYEKKFRKKNGETFWVTMSIRSIDEQGKPQYFLANWVDVTERKKMEESLNDSYQKEKLQREELEEEARLRGHFINVLAHELRTPITPILSSTDMLKNMYASKKESIQKKLVENIYNSSNTLAKRLEELLDMARHARGAFKLNIQPVELKPFMEGVISRFKPTLMPSKQKLVVDLDLTQPCADLDASRLEQVMVNLLSNASKFSGEMSVIHLRVKATSSQLLVDVKDNGIGISTEGQARLFQPYYRVEQDRHQVQGLGLGLAVSKQIIEAHGGKIWVVSEKGQGSTFSFKIPFINPA